MKLNTATAITQSTLLLLLSSLLLPSASAKAEELDFSCMIQSVLPRTMVTVSHQEFDVVLENECPGSVNWTMCIERMDPFTNRVTETLTPSGQIDKDKKFRINLQMKKQEDKRNGLTGYDEFYVNVVYAVDSELRPSCVARQCESDKKPVREKIRANERARQKAQADMNRKMASQCPKSGWSDAQQEKCMAQIQKDAKPEMDSYAKKARELRSELAEIKPDECEIHSVK